MSSRSRETAQGGNDRRRDEHTAGKSQLSTVQSLLGYITSSTNPLTKYVEEVTSQVIAVAEETEKITLRCNQEVEESKRKISDLQAKFEHTERNCTRYREERNELRQNAPGDREGQQLKRQLAEQKHNNDRDYKELEKKHKDLKESCDVIISAQKLQIDQNARDLRHKETEIERLKEDIEGSKFGFSDTSALRKKLEDSQKQLNDTNDKLHWAKTKLRETEKELDDTKTRLSTAMGNQLTNNNPNIADLSDKNRPTKLAERYAELYDNQWTDAYEKIELHFTKEEDIIEVLLKILENISDFCNRAAQQQMGSLEKALTFSDNQRYEEIPTTIAKQLKDCRKAMYSVSKEHIYKIYVSQLEKSRAPELRQAMGIQKFVLECFDICWLMAIQDPPLVFASNGKGEIFNTELYKAYTKNGMYVKFVVWPAMRLYKDGPVLAKGVAQGESGYKGKDKLATDYADVHNPYTGRKLDKRTYTKGQLVSTSNNANYQVYSDYKEQSIERNIAAEMEKARHRRAKSEEERRRTEQPILTKMSTGTRSVWKPHREYDREPTRDEMRTYFNYFDRREYGKARDVLGGKAYFRCMQYEHKRHMYVN